MARPPCGSLLSTATNSVPLPVSGLKASSEMIRDDRGDAVDAMRSSTSCGMTMRSGALFAALGH
jgi:hypothetical protein